MAFPLIRIQTVYLASRQSLSCQKYFFVSWCHFRQNVKRRPSRFNTWGHNKLTYLIKSNNKIFRSGNFMRAYNKKPYITSTIVDKSK